MFTGLVEETGRITALERLNDDAARITVAAHSVLVDVGLGDSIAVNGVCLTVAERDARSFTADVMAETLASTSLGQLDLDRRVNLERAATADTRLGGHLVQGHVDGTAVLTSIAEAEHWRVLRFALPTGLAKYVAHKGSITIDGVSLTVSAISPPAGDAAPPATIVGAAPGEGRHWVEVSLIPVTQAETTLGGLTVGDRVNVEVDVIAKYVARLMEVGQG
ncbi:MAG: riboflavin synthase [Actinomycetia bacterium]|nr:riboflavin synthase [Actinomycetes bacterium]